MNAYEELLSLLAQVHLQHGQVYLNSVLDDGHALGADVTFSGAEVRLVLRHTRWGELTFLPDRTVWVPPGQAAVVDQGVDHRPALEVLRGGVQPELSWLTRAFRLVRWRDPRLAEPIGELRRLRNQVTGIIIPGVANLNLTLAARTLGALCLPPVQGDVALRNVTIDVASRSVAFTLQILRGTGLGPLVFDPDGCGSPTPGRVRVRLAGPEINLTLEVLLRLNVPAPGSGLPTLLAADLRVLTAEFTAARADGTFVVDDPGDPLRLDAAQGCTLKIADLATRVQPVTGPAPTIRTHGGPVEFWMRQGVLRKQTFPVGQGQVVPDAAGVEFRDLNFALVLDDVRGGPPSPADLRRALRGTFHLPSLQFRGNVELPGVHISQAVGRVALRRGRFGPGHREVAFEAVELRADQARVQMDPEKPDEFVHIKGAFVQLSGSYADSVPTTPGGPAWRRLHVEQARFAAGAGQLALRHKDVNTYLDLAGDGGFVRVLPGKLLPDGNAVSARLLVLPRAKPPAGRPATLLGYRGATPSGLHVFVDPDGKLGLEAVHASGTFNWLAADPLPLNRLTEVLLAFNGTHWSVFLDGMPLPAVSAPGALVVPADGTALTLGGAPGPQGQSLDGWVVEAQVWHAAVNPTQSPGAPELGPTAALLLRMEQPPQDTSPNHWPVELHGNATVGPRPFALDLAEGLVVAVTDLVSLQTPTVPGGVTAAFRLQARRVATAGAAPIHLLRASDLALIRPTFSGEGIELRDGGFAALDGQEDLNGVLGVRRVTALFDQVHAVMQGRSKPLRGLRGVRPFQAKPPPPPAPPPPPQPQELLELTLDLDRKKPSRLAAGLFLAFDQARLELGTDTFLTIDPGEANLLRGNLADALPMQENQAVQFRAGHATLTFPDPLDKTKFLVSTLDQIGLDAFVRNYLPDLAPNLRALKSQLRLLFALMAQVPEVNLGTPGGLRLDLDDMGALRLALRILEALLNLLGHSTSGFVSGALGWAADAVGFIVGVLSLARAIRPGLLFQPTPLTAAVYTDPLPPPITPNTDNQVVMRVRVGLDEVKPYIAYTYPEVGWEDWHPTVSFKTGYLDGPDLLPGSINLDLLLRLTLQYDSVTRRVLIQDSEIWVVPDFGGSKPAKLLRDIILGAEDLVKKIFGAIFQLDKLFEELRKQLNARLGEKVRLPDNWDVNLARIRVQDGKLALTFGADVDDWNSMP